MRVHSRAVFKESKRVCNVTRRIAIFVINNYNNNIIIYNILWLLYIRGSAEVIGGNMV